MPAGQEVPLQPSLALVFAQDLHHPTIRRQVVVVGIAIRHPGAVGDLQDVLPAVRVVLVRAEEAEVSTFHIQLHRVPAGISP